MASLIFRVGFRTLDLQSIEFSCYRNTRNGGAYHLVRVNDSDGCIDEDVQLSCYEEAAAYVAESALDEHLEPCDGAARFLVDTYC